jgi:hypothetical protein
VAKPAAPDRPGRRRVRSTVNAIVWLLVAALCSGCSLIGVGRVSVGLAATTQGSVGLAVSGEVAAGVLFVPPDASRDIGVTEGMYLGGGVMPGGWELETGGRADLLLLDGDRELRAGIRAGVVARETRGAAFAPALAFGLARARWWESERPRLGFELRAGPLIGLDGGARFEELRGYVGITYRATAISRRYDPIDSLFRDVGSKH